MMFDANATSIALSFSEGRVYDALDGLQNGRGRLTSTQAVADAAGYSHDWAYRNLCALEDVGLVWRRSPKSGWMIVKGANV